jgi:hypothetical protein
MRGTIMTWAAVAALGAALAGCGGPLNYAIHGSPKSPELDAGVTAEVRKEQVMTALKITAEHLAPPDRLAGGSTTFVVWARGLGDKDVWQRVGAFKYDGGSRKGGLDGASVPLTTFDLSITLERQPAPGSPSNDVLFSQRVN